MRVWLASSIVLIAAAATPARATDLPADSVEVVVETPIDPENAASDSPDDYRFTEVDPERQFNLARCVCSESPTLPEQRIEINIKWADSEPAGIAGETVEIWAGTDCATADTAVRDAKCSMLLSIPDAVAITQEIEEIQEIGGLMTPGTNNETCRTGLETVTLGAYNSDGTTLTKITEQAVALDMDPPPLPTVVDVAAQEGQITLSWDAIASDASDLEYFQALCAVAGVEAHDNPTDGARYDTTNSLCGATAEPELGVLEIGNADEVTGTAVALTDLPEGMRYLRESFICGESTGSTSQSVTLSGLANGVEYQVILVSVDPAGNPSAAFVPRTLTPQPVTDFWEDVNEDNPELEGGLCLIEATFGAGGGGGGLYGALRSWRDGLSSSAAGRWAVARYYEWGAPLARAAEASIVVRVVVAIALAPVIAVALVWHVLGLPLFLALIAAAIAWRRRRRFARWAVAAGVLLGTPALAAAQSATPYWDDAFADDTSVDIGPKWHVGLRLGPFLPSIDDERLDSMPYDRMFGDGAWMPSIDLHRLFTSRIGQLGGGMSVGYFGKSADAWRPGSDTERAEGNGTSLRIIPFELTAIYRASQLDDNWGIPFVPYARGGLAYSLWWVRRPDGELSKACDGTMETCDRGIGGSLGLVGAAGLALRAERIDGDAARSMRDSGIEHAGFYAEVSMSWVDGFGNEKKLSLGDTTWSAGVDFEF